jgi:adenylate cyclase
MATTRRLVAILAADVVGYSRLMGKDEEGTHARLGAHRRELLDPKIEEHQGRIVKHTGDGSLAEFASVVDAVRCAVEAQRWMLERNVPVAAAEHIQFRIGINVGDVIAEPDDIYGDAVNIAARLEALAEPNGICISQAAYEQFRDRLSYAFTDAGRQTVKNIARPLRIYALGARAIAALPLPAAAAAAAPVAAIGTTNLAPRLSIVVLPFVNLSGDREQQYLADAISEDLTTDLSRIAGMAVIARTTAFAYRDKSVDARQIGRELNVRYVLEGSIRSVGNRIRCNAQLIDAETDVHIWAERFDLNAEDLFWLQDEVTSRIAVALDLELVDAEAARPSANPDALDYILRGRAAHNRASTRESLTEAIQLYENALVLEPGSALTKGLLAHALVGRVLDQLADMPEVDLERAEALIAEVLRTSPRDATGHFAKGQLLRARNQFADTIHELETAVALNRNWVVAIAALGHCKFLAGALEESIPAQEQAIRLSPRDPRLANWCWRIGMVHLLKSRPKEAFGWLQKALAANPRLPGPHAWLAAAHGLAGDLERAAAGLAEARRLSSDDRYSNIARFKAVVNFDANMLDLAEATFFAGLRLAGVPQE